MMTAAGEKKRYESTTDVSLARTTVSFELHSPCIAQHKNQDADENVDHAPITALAYATLQNAFDFFNLILFAGALPQLLITLQRHARTLGYFSEKKFHQRGDGKTHVHEIALNPDGFVGHSDEEICQTLVHEMTHAWQAEFGDGGRGHYHNRQWAAKMRSIGLMPSSTGRPGGAETGDRMSDYILEGGPFQVACRAFLDRYSLVWESSSRSGDAPSADGNGSGSSGGNEPTSDGPKGAKSQTRAKFACPIPKCTETAWAKPSAKLACFTHSEETGELIPLLRVETNQVTREDSDDAR
jgi:hypothetical protein